MQFCVLRDWRTGEAAGSPPATAPARLEPRPRNLSFDTARLIAAILIVWPHAAQAEATQRWVTIGKFGTSFFAAASIYFMVRGIVSRPERTLGGYARLRFLRLYVPFLVWSVIYLLFRDACRWWITGYRPVALYPGMLLAGTEWHLWFLPFILLSSIVAFPVAQFALDANGPPKRRELVALAMAMVGLAISVLPTPTINHPDIETTDFWFAAWWALPSVFWGLALGLSDASMDWLRRGGKRTVIAALVVSVASVAIGVIFGQSVWQKNTAGFAWLVLALSMPESSWQRKLGRWAMLGFGLYLTHPLILGCAMAAARMLHLNDGVPLDIAYFVTGVTGGLGMALLISRTPKLRWLVP
jgi:fucose 4-O-acetylase-like acetyltransferase